MVNHSNDLQLRELEETIIELNNLIKALKATLDDMCKSKEESETDIEKCIRRELKFTPVKMSVLDYYSENYKYLERENTELSNTYKIKEEKSRGLHRMISPEKLAGFIYQKVCNSLHF